MVYPGFGQSRVPVAALSFAVGFFLALASVREFGMNRILAEPSSFSKKARTRSGAHKKMNGIAASRRSPREADGCYHVFLDVGANIGVHARFLFEPHLYPDAETARGIYDAQFGDQRDNRDFCAFEIEANPKHRERLETISAAYAAVGWRLHVKNVAASDREETLTFHRQGDADHEEWGFGIHRLPFASTNETVDVPAIRLATWIQEHINERQLPDQIYGSYGDMGPKVVMKMDIEGAEYVVLPDLMLSGAVCGNFYIFGEFHDNANFLPYHFDGHRIPLNEPSDAADFEAALVKVIPGSRNCRTEFQWLDDESHLHDGMPLPKP